MTITGIEKSHIFIRNRSIAAPTICARIFLLCLYLTPLASFAKAGASDNSHHNVLVNSMAFAFQYIAHNPFFYLFLSLALGYALGKVTIKGVNLGSTAGTLVVGVAISLPAFSVYGLSIHEPSLIADIFLMMFMYAIGMKVGPQFFSGIARGGFDFIVIGLIVVFTNFLLVFFGARLLSMEPGYAAGIISGSYTVTAVMGVAQSAVTSGAFSIPSGMTPDQVSANIAAGYAISYVLSTVFTILFIKYLPAMFGIDPVQAGKDAELSFSTGEDNEPLPTTHGFSNVGVLPIDVRAYKVQHQTLVGQTIEQLFNQYPHAAILKVVRGDKVFEASDNPSLEMGDIIGIRGDYHTLIDKGQKSIGLEVDEPRARHVEIEVADIHLGHSQLIGLTINDVMNKVGFGIYCKALFRLGHLLPLLPQTVIEAGDVLRIAGSDWCVKKAAEKLKGHVVIENTITESFYLAVSLMTGYFFGHLTLMIKGIPFALSASAGCMLAGIIFSYLRTRNPDFGGPMSEGARSFLQDIGLNMFVAVLAATVGPKILQSFQGIVVIKIAGLGLIAALTPPFISWLYGLYIRKMNPAILAGACAGARNSTPGMKAAQEICKTDMPALGYPVPYALTSAIVLILGYIAMVLS